MKPGWFDAFRTDGGPTLYSYSNRTPVTGDVQTITLYLIFFTVFLAFLVIFPGVRKERFTTFTSVTLSLFVGTVILVARYGSGWHVAETQVLSSYRAFSRERLDARLGAYIGLNHVNITLRAMPVGNRSEDIDFNERFVWQATGEMGQGYREALQRGLPFPILTAAEYFSLGQEGFAWGSQYRAAGYYGSILLWAAFAFWLMMNLLLVVVPRYGAYCMVLTGGLLAAADLVYWALLPARPLLIRLEGGMLHFRLGWCFWLVLAAGTLCMLVGLAIAAVDLAFPHRFSTILEVDYDTPYDRHIIIEESHDTRNRKKKSGSRSGSRSLEEAAAAGLGSRILRRLSKRERLEGRHGVVNDAFEMEAPKSPWRYPFPRPIMLRNPHLQRSLSADSGSSVGGDDPCGPPPHSGARPRPLSPLAIAEAQAKVAAEKSKGGGGASCSTPVPSAPTSPTSPVSPTSPLSSSSSSSGSSFGLQLLHRTGSNATRNPAGVPGGASDSPRNSISSATQAVAIW